MANLTTFHGLKMLAHCGGGAYGDVYYCEDISGKKMAVKIVSKKKLGDSWERELQGVVYYRKITENAPGLLQIFHVEEDEESFFYTMEPADSARDTEYVPDTLAYRLQSGPLPQTDLLRILSGVFDGIKRIHEAGFTHRDIKPDNIIFVKGVPKLADIGLISSLSNSKTQLAGTLDFIPPEERGADSLASSDKLSRQRNDLYAFGKVIYCSVTGLDPHSWPAVPKELPLSLPLKFFLRLSFRLCDKDPARRLNTIEDVQKEFAEIERKLMYGETFKDRISYIGENILQDVKGLLFSSWRLLKHYWYLMFLFILIGGGTAYWIAYRIWKPEEPFDIAKVTTQIYRNADNGFSLTIPKQWEVKKNETIQKEIAESKSAPKENMTKFEKRRHDHLLEMSKFGIDVIDCDFDEEFQDYIAIQAVPVPGKMLMEMPDDEFRIGIRKLSQGELGYKTEIYEMKRITINGMPCVFIDLSHEPEKARSNNYLFMLPDKCFAITLFAKKSTFMERREQFSEIIQTIKFDTKQ